MIWVRFEGTSPVLKKAANLYRSVMRRVDVWSNGRPEEWKTDFVRSPVKLMNGDWAEGFVAHRTIGGEVQYRIATEDEKQDLITLRMTS